MAQGVVAIVGSPNVGKSTIFNRMIGERHAIVDDEMGITRDRLYGQCEWLGRRFSLIDTGGIEIVNRPFQEQIRMQAEIAINEADVIVFVVDGKLGITTDDRVVTTILRKVKKPIILAVNKIDEGSHMADAQEFYGLLTFLRMVVTTLSSVVIPSLPSTTNTITSASFIAISACIRICSWNGRLTISIPPVSIKEK